MSKCLLRVRFRVGRSARCEPEPNIEAPEPGVEAVEDNDPAGSPSSLTTGKLISIVKFE